MRISTILQTVLISIGVLCFTGRLDAQWTKVDIPAPYDSGHYLDVFFLPSNPNLGWASSIEGYVIRTVDGGKNWQGVRLPVSFFESIQFVNPFVGYTSGDNGIYKSIDGGATWLNITPADHVQNNGAWGCYFVSEFVGVYLEGGCSNGKQKFYKTTDGGISWSLFITSEFNSGLTDAIIESNGNGFAVSSGVLWRTGDYGSTWSRYSYTGSKVWNEELSYKNNTFCLPVAGNDCNGQNIAGGIRWSHDGGRSWSQFNTGVPMFGSFVIDEKRMWAVGSSSAVYYTDDGGDSWIRRICGVDGDLDDIWFVNDTLGFLAGRTGLWRSDFNAPKKIVQVFPEDAVLRICPGESVNVNATSGFDRYKWSDGPEGDSRTFNSPGKYILSAFDQRTCQESKDTVIVAWKSEAEIGIQAASTIICYGDSVELNISGPYVSVQWNTGATTPVISVSQTGSYSAVVIDTAGCTYNVSQQITVREPLKTTITSNRPITICIGEVVTLAAPPGYSGYLWSNGETSPSITTGEAGEYSVQVTDRNGCNATSASVRVNVIIAKNKVQVNATGEVPIVAHNVGDVVCMNLGITNIHDTEPLIITKPFFVGNVFFSVPQAQLPLFISPGEQAELQCCAMSIELGIQRDTLVIPDTCFSTLIPFVTEGLPIQFLGTSRCSVAIDGLQIRAGGSWKLFPPYPTPASEFIHLELRAVQSQPMDIHRIAADVIDTYGRVRAPGVVVVATSILNFQADVSELEPGLYFMRVLVDGSTERIVPVSVIR